MNRTVRRYGGGHFNRDGIEVKCEGCQDSSERKGNLLQVTQRPQDHRRPAGRLTSPEKLVEQTKDQKK